MVCLVIMVSNFLLFLSVIDPVDTFDQPCDFAC